MKQEAFFRKQRLEDSRGVFGNQQGQAVIEYILLMVIIVSLVLGMRGVFSSMNNFMSNIMGEYVACLMEFGELPSLGIQDSKLKEHAGGGSKQCALPNFSASASFPGGSTAGGGGGGPGSTGGGKTPGGGSGGGSGGPGGGGNTRNGNNANNGAGKGGNSGSGSGSNSSRSGSGSNGLDSASAGGGGGRKGSSPYTRGQISRTGGASTADGLQTPGAGEGKVKALDGSKVAKDESGGGDRDGAGRRGSRRGDYGRGKYRAVTGAMAQEIEERSKGAPRQPTSTKIATAEGGYRLAALRKTINPPQFKEKIEERKEEEFSFGNFFKWLVIAGILIACFILFGGQVLNYSNSDS